MRELVPVDEVQPLLDRGDSCQARLHEEDHLLELGAAADNLVPEERVHLPARGEIGHGVGSAGGDQGQG